jgi:hypothetical protein
MLAVDEPGLPVTYGCIMSLLVDKGELVQGLIVPPTWARLGGQRAYRFVFGGLAFIFVVSNSPLPRYLSDNFLRQSGKATVKLQQFNELGFLRETFAKMDRLGKFD